MRRNITLQVHCLYTLELIAKLFTKLGSQYILNLSVDTAIRQIKIS